MKRFLILVLFCLASVSSNAQMTNHKMYALFIYKFTQYIQWPSESSKYVVGVIGDSPVTAELENLATTRKNMEVRKVTPGSDMSALHILFVSESNSSQLSGIASKTAGKNILVVSETNAGAKKGAGINFVKIDDKVKFELNKGAVEKQGLKVSGDLISLSIMVGYIENALMFLRT
jgi:hypothetical protein